MITPNVEGSGIWVNHLLNAGTGEYFTVCFWLQVNVNYRKWHARRDFYNYLTTEDKENEMLTKDYLVGRLRNRKDVSGFFETVGIISMVSHCSASHYTRFS